MVGGWWLRLVRDGNQAIATPHILFKQLEKRSADRTGLAVADHLLIPLDDRRDLDGAAEEQHLAAGACLGDRNITDLDSCDTHPILMRTRKLQQPQRRA